MPEKDSDFRPPFHEVRVLSESKNWLKKMPSAEGYGLLGYFEKGFLAEQATSFFLYHP